MSRNQHDDDSECSEKCERLEHLLRQTLALAGEIAEDKGQKRARSAGHLPGECIILRKLSGPDSTGAKRHTVRRGVPKATKFRDVGEESEGSQCPSAASSVQEPFSPGILALSLDAIVEGNRSGSGSCLLDSGSATPFAGRFPETPNKKSSPLSVEETREHEAAAAARLPPPLQRTASERPRERQRRAPPPSKATTSTQTPASPQAAEHPRIHVRSASTHSCPLPAGHAPARPVLDTLKLLTLDASPPPGEGGEGRHEAAGGEDQPLPSKWHAWIVPMPWSPGSGSGSPPATSPALVRLEAVFPYSFFANGVAAATPPGWGSEGSYIIIGRPPGGSRFQDYGQGLQDVRDKSLQEYIDEWDDYAAGTPEVDDAR